MDADRMYACTKERSPGNPRTDETKARQETGIVLPRADVCKHEARIYPMTAQRLQGGGDKSTQFPGPAPVRSNLPTFPK